MPFILSSQHEYFMLGMIQSIFVADNSPVLITEYIFQHWSGRFVLTEKPSHTTACDPSMLMPKR